MQIHQFAISEDNCTNAALFGYRIGVGYLSRPALPVNLDTLTKWSIDIAIDVVAGHTTEADLNQEHIRIKIISTDDLVLCNTL
jgi:hypothetical protein